MNRLGKVVGEVMLFTVIPNALKDRLAAAVLLAWDSMIWLSDGSAGCKSDASDAACSVNAVSKLYATGFLISGFITLLL